MSDYETTERRRNIIVGIFVILGMCAFVWLIAKFGDLPGIVTKVGSFQVSVQFATAPGVQKDTAVLFCGYQIGKITSVEPPRVMEDRKTGHFYHQTLIILGIDKKHSDIPADIDAKLMTRGLGSSYIELKLKHFDVKEPTGPLLIDQEKPLQGSTGMTSEFFPEESQKKLDGLIEGLGTFITNANDVIGDEETKGNIKKILANLAEASEQVAQTIEDFQKFAAAGTATFENAGAKIEQAVTALVDTSEEFQEFAATGRSALESADANFEKLVIALVGTSEELSKAISQLRLILEKVDSGQGTAAKFLNDGRFYENLLEDTQQLGTLIENLKSLVDKVKEKGLRAIY